jgi:hypothetical protein
MIELYGDYVKLVNNVTRSSKDYVYYKTYYDVVVCFIRISEGAIISSI